MPVTPQQRAAWRKERITELRKKLEYAQQVRSYFTRAAETALTAESYIEKELIELMTERRRAKKLKQST